MQTVTTIGLDIAKSVFQVHGVDAEGKVVLRRQLRRRYILAFFQKLPPCLIGIEACASSHHWSRELQALGHTVRLMPPAYVKPYVKRQKNDATDAEAICEAITRANMRFVSTKTPEQQSGLVLNTIRAHLAEFGIIAPVGRHGVEELFNVVTKAQGMSSPGAQHTGFVREGFADMPTTYWLLQDERNSNCLREHGPGGSRRYAGAHAAPDRERCADS